MSLIIPANSAAAAGGFNVANSVRFNGSDEKMTKSSTAGNRTNWTWSGWIKKCSQSKGSSEGFMASWNGENYCYLQFNNSDQLRFLDYTSGNNCNKITNRVFRDISAWYHIVIAINTNDGTAEDRYKLYVNGVRETSFATSANFSSGVSTNMNVSGHTNSIGVWQTGSTQFYNGYVAEAVLIDGTTLAPTSFGEFDEDSGIWKPIDVSSLTFGNNGYYLDFEDSSNLGNDANGGTDFTEANLAATDQFTDTCTNNFATLNPLHSIGAASELSQGNLEYDPSGHHRIISTIAPSSGKWYAEVKGIDSPDKFMAGICYYPIPANGSASSFAFGQGVNADVGRWSNDFGVRADGQYGHNNSWSSYMSTPGNNDIIGIYMDLDNYKLYFSLNGSLVSSTGKDLTNNGEPYGFISVGEGGTFQWNFGNPSFAISSGNTDGEYGNFEYSTTITGDGASKTFKALCTKNLSEYG